MVLQTAGVYDEAGQQRQPDPDRPPLESTTIIMPRLPRQETPMRSHVSMLELCPEEYSMRVLWTESRLYR